MNEGALLYSYEFVIYTRDRKPLRVLIGGCAVIRSDPDGWTIRGAMPSGWYVQQASQASAIAEWRVCQHNALLDMAAVSSDASFIAWMRRCFEGSVTGYDRDRFLGAAKSQVTIDRHGVIPEKYEKLGQAWWIVEQPNAD